jgi:hypothetical protein
VPDRLHAAESETSPGTKVGHYHDDTVELEGLTLFVQGPIVGASVAEFTTGLKIGKATYDEREHAFWLVLDDFSGGFGHRTLDIREALGTHWDNDGGVDLRRPRHVTLPAKRHTLVEATNLPTNTGLFGGVEMMPALVSDFHDVTNGLVYLGVYDTLYTITYDTNTGQRTSLTRQKVFTNYARITRILDFVGSDGTRGIYVCGYGTNGENNEYWRNTDSGDVTNWTTASSISSSGKVYANDMFVWKDQLVAQMESREITSSADGENWVLDDAADNTPIYRGKGYVQFIGVSNALWGGDVSIYMIERGQLIALDVDTKSVIPISDVGDQNSLYTGTMWGGSVFVSDGFNIWQYTPGMQETVRHIGPFGKEGVPPTWGDDVFRIEKFLPGTTNLFVICRSIDRSGSPRTGKCRLMVYNDAGWSWYGDEIDDVIPYGGIIDRLPAAMSLNEPTRFINIIAPEAFSAATKIKVFSYKLPTTGDIPYVGAPAGATAQQMFYENGELQWETGWIDGGFAELDGALFRLHMDGYRMTAEEYLKVEYRLDNKEEAPYDELGTFTENQGLVWFDEARKGVTFKTAQFRFTLKRETVGLADSGATVNDANFLVGDTSFTCSDGTQFAVGDVIQVDDEKMRVLSIATHVLTVERGAEGTTAAGHDNGLTIYDVEEFASPAQLAADTTIGDTWAKSPQVRGIILLYDKSPNLRTAWTIRVDVNRMVERGREDDGYDTNIERVWHALRALWNTSHLLTLKIPSVEPGGIQVKIADMPITISDFRKEVGGKGYIDLQLLEPVT